MTNPASDSEILPDERLLLAKYFYNRGSDILRDGGFFDPGLAVSLFQDSVEIMLLACGGSCACLSEGKDWFRAALG